jgi:hypothetical protein
VKNAPLWETIFSRNGKRYGFRYTLTGIEDDFKPKSGFISRPGVVHAAGDNRTTWYAERGSLVEAVTGDILFDDTWQYQHFVHQGDAQDKKFHVSGSVGLRGGWNVGAGVYWETFGWDKNLYAGYRILGPSNDTLPFTGVGRIPNRDYVVTLTTPQWKRFDANMLYVGGQDENFFEWAQANIDYLSLTMNARPSPQIRLGTTLQYQDYWRRSDGTLAGRNVIPRVKVEYQLTRSIFMRVVGEYDLSEHDDLRDETRTFYPLIVNGQLASATRDHSLHGDLLFSYQPNPGTVLFLGYGSAGEGDPDPTQRYTFQPIRRMSDYVFLKYSYLFRM